MWHNSTIQHFNYTPLQHRVEASLQSPRIPDLGSRSVFFRATSASHHRTSRSGLPGVVACGVEGGEGAEVLPQYRTFTRAGLVLKTTDRPHSFVFSTSRTRRLTAFLQLITLRKRKPTGFARGVFDSAGWRLTDSQVLLSLRCCYPSSTGVVILQVAVQAHALLP